MRPITLPITDKEYNHFVELPKSLRYITKIELDDEPTKEKILNNLKKGFEEMKLFKNGKLKTTSAKNFLNKL